MPATKGVTTRASNANKHPGTVAQAAKKRTHEEVEQEKALKWAARQLKEQQKQKGRLDIADLEAVLRAGDAKQAQERQGRSLRRTSSIAEIPLYDDDDDDDDDDEPDNSNNGQVQGVSNSPQEDDGNTTEPANEPPKKKAKAVKAERKEKGQGVGPTRQAINTLGKELEGKVRSYCIIPSSDIRLTDLEF
jgi:hypothetical protein